MLKSVTDTYTLPEFSSEQFRNVTSRYFDNRPSWFMTDFDRLAWERLVDIERYLASNYYSNADVCINYSHSIMLCKRTWGTSPGWPYNAVVRYKVATPDDLPYWIEEAECLAEAMLEGERPVVFNLFFKDELLKTTKLKEGKQRAICGASFNFIIIQTYVLNQVYEYTIRARLDRHNPYRLGLNVLGRDYHELCRIHDQKMYHWCSDISGLEFVVPEGMYKKLYEIYREYVPSDRRDLLTCCADQLSRYVVRGDRIGICEGGTPSGHKGTSEDNSRITNFLLTLTLLEQEIDLEDVVVSVQGDDAWLSFGDKTFDPVRAKEFCRQIGVTLKGSDRLVSMEETEFLSRTPILLNCGVWVSKCSADRQEKLWQAAYVLNKTTWSTTVNEKFQSFFFMEAFNDYLWPKFLEAYEYFKPSIPQKQHIEFDRDAYQWKRLHFEGLH